MPFYAVARGRIPGVYYTWNDCERQVKGFSGAKFKKFQTVASAKDFINSNSDTISDTGYTNRPTNNYQSTSTNNRKRSYATSSKNMSYDFKNRGSTYSRDNEQDAEPFRDDWNGLKKQIDDLENRVNSLQGIDKIAKGASNAPQCKARQSIAIEPPQPKKYRHNETTDFEEDNEGYVQVYTNGAYSVYGKHGRQAGLDVYSSCWFPYHPNRTESVSGPATNNCGKIQAASLAIKVALQNGVKKLAINTDSLYLINAATKWMPEWKQRGWKLSSGEALKNAADFKELEMLQNKIKKKSMK